MTNRYLKQTFGDGRTYLYVWSKPLSKRSDMTEISEEEAMSMLAKVDVIVKQQKYNDLKNVGTDTPTIHDTGKDPQIEIPDPFDSSTEEPKHVPKKTWKSKQ